MKSGHSKKGILSPIAAVLRWFWSPRQNPHAEEERADRRRRDKRRRAAQASSGPSKSRDLKKRATGAATDQDLAYVDKAGNVRLTDGGRIVAKASKGSKAGALAEARALFQTRHDALDALSDGLASPDTSLADLEPQIAQLKTDLREAPGLGDLVQLETAFTALTAALEARKQEQWNHKRGIITRLEGLTRVAPSGLEDQIHQLSEDWEKSGSAGSVHDTVLHKRYTAALEAARNRVRLAHEKPELFAAERQSVLDDVVDLMASSDRKGMLPQLEGLRTAWEEAGGPDDAALDEQFTRMAAAIEQDVKALQSETQSLRLMLEAEATTLEHALDALSEDGSALTDGRSLNALAKSVARMERQAAGANRDVTDKLQRRVDDLRWRADREQERRRTQVAGLVESARAALSSVDAVAGEMTTLKEWRTVENAAKAGLETAEATLDKLKDLGRSASVESSSISAELRAARKALNDARKTFFESLDEGRETNSFRKRTLLDRLSHPPSGGTVKELDEHVEAVMADWKQTGSAGRETDQALWAEFQELRAGLRMLRDEASAAERDEFGARLAEAFTRKRQLSYVIEDEIRIGQMVLENQSDPKFAKELRRKERRLEELRKDLSDIQRKLKKLSNVKTNAPKRQEMAQPSDSAA